MPVSEKRHIPRINFIIYTHGLYTPFIWSSPIHLASKKDPRPWRNKSDFHKLNAVTISNCYPIPHIYNISLQLSRCAILSKLTWCVYIPKYQSHWKIHTKSNTNSIHLRQWLRGTWLRIPLGLKNAAQTFKRLINFVTKHLPFCFPYLDDPLIFSTSAEHKKHFRFLFERLQKYAPRINLSKCLFGKEEIEFLGHLITA